MDVFFVHVLIVGFGPAGGYNHWKNPYVGGKKLGGKSDLFREQTPNARFD